VTPRAVESPAKRRHRRRITRVTRWLALGSVVATGVFAAAAAHSKTGVAPAGASSGFDATAQSDDDDGGGSSSLAPTPSAPTPSYAPPVASSGGS